MAQTQSAITCSKLTIETLEQGVKYVHASVSIVNFEQANSYWVKESLKNYKMYLQF